MQKALISSGAVSVASFGIGQALRFASNIALAKMLAPSSFGLMAIVNMVMLGLALLSDLGLRLVVVQHREAPTSLFLNTVWVLQVVRGAGIWLIASLLGIVLIALQARGFISDNVYGDPMLPYMVLVGAFGVLFTAVESTNSMMAARALAVQRIAMVGLVVQILSLVALLLLAHRTASPWALVVGGLVGSMLQCAASYLCFGKGRNAWQFDRQLATDILKKARWFLVSSPMTFLELNGAVLLLGALVNPTELGQFMIASSIVGVFRLVAQQLTSSIMFPAFSASFRDAPNEIGKLVNKFQLATDAILVVAAGGFFVAGTAIIDVLFDHRYQAAGQLVSILGIGLIGSRQCVAEQLMTARGWFKVTPLVILPRLVALLIGCLGGYQYGGLNGAAWGIALSWFAAWPYIYWMRSKIHRPSLKIEAASVLFLATGCGLGYLFGSFVI